MKTNVQPSGAHGVTRPTYDLSLPPMSAADLEERRECEATIQNGMAVMEDMAEAATRLRDKMLYRNTHGTWEAYCAEHFGRSARRIQQICAGQGVIKEFEVLPNPPSVRPTNEKQVRPLVGLPPRERREVWDTAVAESDGQAPSASKVKAVADRKKNLAAENTKSAEGKDWLEEAVLEAIAETRPGDFVDVRMLMLAHDWERAEAADVFDALVNRDLVKGGRWVGNETAVSDSAEARPHPGPLPHPPSPGSSGAVQERGQWPKPNEHGVYDHQDARVERLEFKHGLARAEVLVLQVGSGWISQCNYSHRCGNRVTNGGPLKASLMHTTRESALMVALDDLRNEHLGLANERGGHPKQKQVAKMIAEWCGTQLRDLNGTRKEGGAHGVTRPTETTGRLDLGEEYRGAADRKVSTIAQESGGTIDELLESIRGLPVPLAAKFGQAIYFLGCARTELGRLAKDPDNAKARSETGGTQRRDAAATLRATAKERLRQLARARWNKAKALGKKLGKGKK